MSNDNAAVLEEYVELMALHNTDDRNEAIDQISTKLYEHYSKIAAQKELSFDKYLAYRIAVKSREFNSAINAPGREYVPAAPQARLQASERLYGLC